MSEIVFWVCWFVFCVSLVLLGCSLLTEWRSSGRFPVRYVPILFVAVVLVVFLPLLLLGVRLF